MKLHQTSATPSCKRVTIFAKELGLTLDSVELDVRAGDNLSSEFLSKAPNGRVPLLELDDGNYVSESVAICRYLDEVTDNDLYLFGRTALQKAQVEMWHRIVELQGLFVAFQAFRNISGVYKDRENCVEDWGLESKSRVEQFLPVLESRLANSPYVAGDNYSIADISAAIFIIVCKNALQLDVLSNNPNIKKWFEGVTARAAFN